MHKVLILLGIITFSVPILGQQSNCYIDAEAPVYYTPGSFDTPPSPGDTIFIASDRTKALIFKDIEGSFEHPIRLVQLGLNERKCSKFYFDPGKKRRRCLSIGEAF